MSSSSKPLILITGATGHIGSSTLVFALENGYRVRVSSRSLASAHKLKDIPSINPISTMSIKCVDYIVHLASPLPEAGSPATIDVKRHLIEPAHKGAVGILESASKYLSVKRVVIASSIAVLGRKESATSPIGPDDLAPVPDPDSVEQNPVAGYRASKRISHDAATKFMENKRPHFDLIRILPSFVQGRNLLVTSKDKLRSGSNAIMLDLVLGKKAHRPSLASTVLVDDVAKILVLALDSERAKGGENYIAAGSPSGKGIKWEDATGIAEELFPEALKSGVLTLGGRQDSITVDYGVSKSEAVFGFKFADLRAQVQSLVGQYVELASK